MKRLTPPARIRALALTALLALLAACSTRAPVAPQTSRPTPCPACPSCPSCPADASAEQKPPAAPLQAASWSDLPGWVADDHAAAWPALLTSCRTLGKQPRWQKVCGDAARLGPTPPSVVARQFFERAFDPWVVVNPDGSREGLITGYYEPLIKGSRVRSPRYTWPIHGVPPDMLTVDFGDLYPEIRNLRLRGRLVGNKVVPYWSRGELDRMEPAPAPALLWAEDPLDLFFLHVQGSGRVELPDGSLVRIGYADQNGHPYQSIGRWLVAQGELPLDKASMEGIKDWARANPQRLPQLLASNPSYVFFRELPSSGGPLGAMGLPLTQQRSIAVDPRVIPLGAPVFLATTWPNSGRPLQRLTLAQDTGGAIKGAVRADFFWGFGAEAGVQAGKMRERGQLWVLLPKEPGS